MKVRNLARAMVTRFGMSDTFPNYAPVQSDGQNVFSEETSTRIDKQVIRVIEECTALTERQVKLYRDKIEKLAEQVLKKESLNHQQIKAILGERPFEAKQNYKQFLTLSTDAKRADAVV